MLPCRGWRSAGNSGAGERTRLVLLPFPGPGRAVGAVAIGQVAGRIRRRASAPSPTRTAVWRVAQRFRRCPAPARPRRLTCRSVNVRFSAHRNPSRRAVALPISCALNPVMRRVAVALAPWKEGDHHGPCLPARRRRNVPQPCFTVAGESMVSGSTPRTPTAAPAPARPPDGVGVGLDQRARVRRGRGTGWWCRCAAG